MVYLMSHLKKVKIVDIPYRVSRRKVRKSVIVAFISLKHFSLIVSAA